MNSVIAIDGVAGSGKSSTAREVARQLRFAYLDTGAYYRAATYYCMAQEVPFEDEISVYCAVMQLVSQTAYNAGITTALSPDEDYVLVDNVDVTTQIRQPDLTEKIHYISSNHEVRKLLVKLQQAIVQQYSESGIVLEGRDTTDVVAKDARVRILLTASSEVRALRRAKQIGLDAQEVEKLLERRDEIDAQTNQFHTPTDSEIVVLDTSELTVAQTSAKIIELYNRITVS
jgi:cytidylate kinase